MKDWFHSLDPRERMMVTGGAALLVLLVLYLLIIEPLSSSYSALSQKVTQQQETLVWMRQAAQQVQALKRTSVGAARGLGGRSLLAVVDQSMSAAGMGNSVKRIEPDGSKGVKVWLESAAFDTMIVWLGNLTRSYQIETSLITIEPVGNGQVNARLTLLEPGA
jgi:general secretion pathway protein M